MFVSYFLPSIEFNEIIFTVAVLLLMTRSEVSMKISLDNDNFVDKGAG